MGKQILIIGSGVIGLCTAYYAFQRGHRVTVLERGPADRDNCSFGNAGMIVPSHLVPLAAPGVIGQVLRWIWKPTSPFYIKPRLSRELLDWGWKFYRAANAAHVARAAPLLRDLHLASRACFEELALQTHCDFGLVQKGLLMLCKTDRALEEEARLAQQACQLGVPAEVLDARQTAELEPNIRMNIAGAVYFPKDCHLSPERFLMNLTRELERAGVQFAWETEVIDWRARGDRVDAVRTTRGDFVADEYVICGGAWSSLLVRGLELYLPMQAGKGYSLTLPNPRQLPARCAIFTEARVAVTPIGNALRFGGTMEIVGLEEGINAVRIQSIIQSVPRYYPDFTPNDFHGVRPWYGLRPCSPDGLPYVGRFARYGNLAVATGHAMMGLSLGPITGKLMAELLSGEKPSISIELLAPDRYMKGVKQCGGKV
jgi:D-amino-acid dehydrogenase